jgi:hypothetical protein
MRRPGRFTKSVQLGLMRELESAMLPPLPRFFRRVIVAFYDGMDAKIGGEGWGVGQF